MAASAPASPTTSSCDGTTSRSSTGTRPPSTRLGPDFGGARLQGSALDRQILVRAGIERADAVAVVTGQDEINAVVARAAKVIFRVPVVVARLHDPRNAEIHQRLGIRTLAPVAWGIRRIADLLTASLVEPVARARDR